jgi:hypothetical protein
MKVLAGALVVLAVTSVLLYPLCHQVFRCGCRTMWGGAADHCNVNETEGPHCPWCESPRLGAFGFLMTLGLQASVFAVARWRRVSVPSATLAAVVALPPAVLVSGGASWLATDYPHFVVKDARERLGVAPGPVRTTGARPGASPLE